MSYLLDNTKIKNYVHNVDTSFTKEAVYTTIEYYPGTEVTYTPSTGANKVFYECSIQTAWTPDAYGSYLNTRLQYSDDNGSSWNDISGLKIFEGTLSANADYDWWCYMWMFSIDSWSGERKIRLAGRSHNTSTDFTIGRSYNATSSEGVGSCPHVSIYSVM